MIQWNYNVEYFENCMIVKVTKICLISQEPPNSPVLQSRGASRDSMTYHISERAKWVFITFQNFCEYCGYKQNRKTSIKLGTSFGDCTRILRSEITHLLLPFTIFAGGGWIQQCYQFGCHLFGSIRRISPACSIELSNSMEGRK